MYLLVFLLLQVFSLEMDTYHIKFERSGGFAGLNRSLELKSDTLSTEEQDHLSSLINSSGFFDTKEITSSGAPDQFNYKVTIKSGNKENTVELGESDIPDKLRPLIDFLTAKLRSG